MNYNAHSVCLTYYHLIMIVKYRRKVTDDSIFERAKEIWEYIVPLRKGRKSIEYSIPLSDLSNRKSENPAGKDIWMLPFPV